MIRIPGLLILAAALSGCATSPAKTLPVCVGHHRRPANPYGSVLDAAQPSAAPVTAAPVTPPPAAPAAASAPGCAS